MSNAPNTIDPPKLKQLSLNQIINFLSKRWILVFSVLYGLFVGLPFLAPVLMYIGWEAPARALYYLYSFFCHQLPQRSFFLFGPQASYSLEEIHSAWQYTLNPFVLRKFVGSPEMGWKVAWSDRMVSMYGSILLFAWIWYPLRRKIKALSFFWFAVLIFPMALDGVTHLISDFAGLGQGFRDNNLWLANIFDPPLSAEFTCGDKLLTFNSWMRLISGTLFGLGIVWYGFPFLEEAALDTQASLNPQQVQPGTASLNLE
ncbi:MAG: DUF2085 domain-containing protein [Anaerolineae bacterium]|nr:DUF2085 domain-containing protein [Anaerolineae bacterium]